MKPHSISYLALCISLCALGYAAWLHLNAERLAMNALRQRERELVEELAPQFEVIHRDMLPNKPLPTKKPTTFKELLEPLVILMETVGDTGEPTNSLSPPK